MDTVLLLSLFRSSRYQRWTGGMLRPRLGPANSSSAEPRVGVVIDAEGLSAILPLKAIAYCLAGESTIAKVSLVERASSGHVRRLVRRHQLDRLVVGGQYDNLWTGEVSSRVFGGVKPQGTAVRVVDLGCLYGPGHGSEEATAKALLLLLAAVARVRSPDVLTRASVDEELQALLRRGDVGLSPLVPVLTCPAALASLRVISQLGMPPCAIPVEVPCHLNMDRLLTARALELGATAVLVMGCVPGCALGCRTSEREAEDPAGRSPSPSTGEDRPLVTVTVFGFRGLVEALDICVSRVSPRDRPVHGKPDSSYAA